MANTTVEFWEARRPGYAANAWHSLHTYARSIQSLTGRLKAPSLKGEDWNVEGVVGETWLPKVIGTRTMSIGMVVLGADDEGNVPADSVQMFNTNLKVLMDLLFSWDEQVTFRRRWKEGGGVTVLYGTGQYAGGLDPQMTGRTRGVLVADFKMTDPYWYTDEAMTLGARLW